MTQRTIFTNESNYVRIDESGHVLANLMGTTAIEMLHAMTHRLDEVQQEVASVLMLMDGLAEQWGDEGVFRRCRDRLRAIVPITKEEA